MKVVQDAEGKGYLPDGHFDKSVNLSGVLIDGPRRGTCRHRKSCDPARGRGKASLATAKKAKKPIAAILNT